MSDQVDLQELNNTLSELSSAIEASFAAVSMANVQAQCQALRVFLDDLELADHQQAGVDKLLGMGWYDLGISYRDVKDVKKSDKAYKMAIVSLEKLTDSPKHAEFSVNQIAACRNHLGLLYMEHGPEDKAAEYLDAAISDRESIAKQYPGNEANQVYLGGAACNRGHVERHVERNATAIEYYQRSIKTLEAVIPPCDCGCRDATNANLPNTKGHPDWIVLAHAFLCNAAAGQALAEKES